MKSYCRVQNKEIKTPVKVEKFLKELFELYEKYNFSISHEDGHGGFLLENNNQSNVDWMKDISLALITK